MINSYEKHLHEVSFPFIYLLSF